MSAMEVSRYAVAEMKLGPASAADPSRMVDVTFVDPDGAERRVPAFSTGGEWRVRYSSGVLGTHRFRSEVSDDHALARPEGTIDVVVGGDPRMLYSRGPLQVARDRRHLEHADGTPFLWLADTWWYGFAERLSLDDFRCLAAKRAQQGFSVVQIVAGLYCETVPFAPEARSESGWVWQQDFTAPNPAWFDEADQRIAELIEHNLVPCIVGSWAHYLRFMDAATMLRHWRELIARWGALPVAWCLAGEPPGVWFDEVPDRMSSGSSTTEDSLLDMMKELEPVLADRVRQLNEVARGVRRLEPFGRPLTIHSSVGVAPWHYLEDESVIDFWLLQTGHQGANSLVPSVNAVHEALAHKPSKPVINGESCYEGIAGSSWHEIQRFLFWTHLLSGAAGHSYGAHGVWNFTTTEYPGFYSGRSPMWQEAASLPGATHVGLGRRLLMSLPWHRFEPHPEWVDPHQHVEDRCLPYAAGLESGPRVFYFPGHALVRNQASLRAVNLRALGAHRWQAQLIDPRNGAIEPEFVIEPERDDTARLRCGYEGYASLPSWEDWLLVLRPAT